MDDATSEPRLGDAFGNTLLRCWRAGGAHGVAWTIVERDDGHIAVHDAAGYFTAADALSPMDRWACGQVRGRVLDAGCAAGRHASVLQGRGHAVVGLDPSPGAVRVARERGLTAVPGSLEEPPADLGTFDTILLLGNNLGLLESPERAPALLDGLARLARPGARLIGANTDPRTDNPDHRSYQEDNRHNGRWPGQLRIRIRDGLLASPWFGLLLLSPADLGELTAPSPWRLDHVRTDGHPGYVALLTLRPR